jgi:very-short-patch-repair endonuclease
MKADLFCRLVKSHTGLQTTTEYKFHPKRRWRFDFAWPDHKLALECDGAVWTNGRHTRGSGFVKDMEKFNEAARLGWTVIKCTPDQLLSTYTLDLIREITQNKVAS